MVMIQDKKLLDKIAAEMGFMTCDISNAIYKASIDKINACNSADELRQQTLTLDDISKYVDTDRYKDIVNRILGKINPVEELKRHRKLEEIFNKIEEKPKKEISKSPKGIPPDTRTSDEVPSEKNKKQTTKDK